MQTRTEILAAYAITDVTIACITERPQICNVPHVAKWDPAYIFADLTRNHSQALTESEKAVNLRGARFPVV